MVMSCARGVPAPIVPGGTPPTFVAKRKEFIKRKAPISCHALVRIRHRVPQKARDGVSL
jgi:hypothetical protein